jgi:hypothetical protein
MGAVAILGLRPPEGNAYMEVDTLASPAGQLGGCLNWEGRDYSFIPVPA